MHLFISDHLKASNRFFTKQLFKFPISPASDMWFAYYDDKCLFTHDTFSYDKYDDINRNSSQFYLYI